MYLGIYKAYVSPRDRSRIDLTARQSIIPNTSLNDDYRGYSEAIESRESSGIPSHIHKTLATGGEISRSLFLLSNLVFLANGSLAECNEDRRNVH